MSGKSSIIDKKPKDAYEQLRPHSGIRYNLSQTEINWDGGITKVHVVQTAVEYEPGQDLTTPPTLEPEARRYAKQRGRGPIWVFQEEIDSAKYHSKKGDVAKDIYKRLIAREREEARSKIGVHKELVKRIGPYWYQELSNKQMSSADELKAALLADYKEGTIWRIQDVFRDIGLVLWPNHTKIQYALKKFHKCPVEFLLLIYNLTTSSDQSSRDSYSLNDRLILSSVVHLTIRDTFRELHLRIPSPPREPKEKNKNEGRGKPKKKPVSPYMEPFFFVEQHLCEGIYKDTHKQCAISRYFNYVDDMYNTWWEYLDTICTHKLRESKYARPPKIPVKNIASKMVRVKRFKLKKPSLYQMACGLVPGMDGKKVQENIPMVEIPNDGKCHCDLRMSPSLLEYVQALGEHMERVRFPCGCLRDKTLLRDPCYMASNVCPCARFAQQNREFEGCTCCPDANNPQGCQCCCNSADIVKNVSNTVDAIQRLLDSNINQIRNEKTTKQIENMLNTNIEAIRERHNITSKSGNLQQNTNPIKNNQMSYPCPFNCGGGQIQEIKEEIEEEKLEAPVVFIDEEVKAVQPKERFICCCKKKPKEEPKPWMKDTFNWDDPYSLCTCVQTAKPGLPDKQFLERLAKYNADNNTEYFPCSCSASPEEIQYKICPCNSRLEEIAEEKEGELADTLNDLVDRVESSKIAESLDLEVIGTKKSILFDHKQSDQSSEVEMTENQHKDCICFKMYEDYVHNHEDCLDLYNQYQAKIKTATEDHIDEIQEARCTCGSNPTSSDSTPPELSEDSCTCGVEEDLINYCRECMGDEEDVPIEEIISNVCQCTREKLFMCTCDKSDEGEDDKKKEEEKGKKKKKSKKKKRGPDDDDDDDLDELEKKIFRLDKFPKDQWDQMDLLQDVLIELAKDGYPLAKLPDCHLLPHFKVWLRKRTRKCVSQEARLALAEKSKVFWNHTTLCRRRLIMATLGLSKKTISRLTWGEIFKHRRLIDTTKTAHYRRVKQAYIDEAQEFFASTYHYDLPMKSFRDCFFAYLPSDENHCFVNRPWQSHEYRQMVGRSCSSS